MSNLIDFLGSLSGYNTQITGYQILDDIYSHSAIVLQDANTIFNIPIISPLFSGSPVGDVGLPLIGLAYKTEGDVELLNYAWAEYPFLSKQIITNAGVKQPTVFSIDAYSVISGANPIALNIFKVQKIVEYLEEYVAKGGLFTILTLFGTIQDCVLERISGVSDDQGPDGTHLKMIFRKTNISSINAVVNNLTSLIQQFDAGGATILGLN